MLIGSRYIDKDRLYKERTEKLKPESIIQNNTSTPSEPKRAKLPLNLIREVYTKVQPKPDLGTVWVAGL